MSFGGVGIANSSTGAAFQPLLAWKPRQCLSFTSNIAVIPASQTGDFRWSQAGIQFSLMNLDSRLRGNDGDMQAANA
jgi:hypothetical protein